MEVERSSRLVSDRDRARAAKGLRGHFAAGRLTEEEFEQRVHGALSARTRADIRAVFADLPRSRRRRRRPPWPLRLFMPWRWRG